MQILKTMYPNYKTILDLRRPKKSGLFPVKIRVTLNRNQKYYPIGVDLSKSDFERIQNSSVRKELRVLKDKIAHWENKAKNIIHQSDPFSFDEFKSLLFKESISVPDVYVLLDKRIEDLISEGRVSTSRVYRDTRNSLKKFKSKLNIKDYLQLVQWTPVGKLY
jgi:hypothetical protein